MDLDLAWVGWDSMVVPIPHPNPPFNHVDGREEEEGSLPSPSNPGRALLTLTLLHQDRGSRALLMAIPRDHHLRDSSRAVVALPLLLLLLLLGLVAAPAAVVVVVGGVVVDDRLHTLASLAPPINDNDSCV